LLNWRAGLDGLGRVFRALGTSNAPAVAPIPADATGFPEFSLQFRRLRGASMRLTRSLPALPLILFVALLGALAALVAVWPAPAALAAEGMKGAASSQAPAALTAAPPAAPGALTAEAAQLHAPLGPSPLASATTGGIDLVDRALAKLATHKRLLVIGAHPDDEDTSALALISREEGGEAAYLALSRGEGGQNLLGPELGVDLGILRSRELLAARGVDGGRQYFSRAYDFGYTRSLPETFQKWPEPVLLEDAVRVIRRFRPQVIISVFPGTPRAGHGQHQAAGVVAHEAFEAAGKADAFPDLSPAVVRQRIGRPWTPEALYRATWWDRDATTFTTELGETEPLTGKTVFQVAMESRSQHRSQDMGRVLPLGSYQGRYGWVAGPGGEGSDRLFAGIDTRLEAIAALLPPGNERDQVAADLVSARELAEIAREKLAPRRLDEAARSLVVIRERLRHAREVAEKLARTAEGETADADAASAVALLEEKERVADAAVAAAAGIAVDAWTELAAVAPGETVRVHAQVYRGEGQRAAEGAEAGSAVIEGLKVRVRGVDLVDPRAHAMDPGGSTGGPVTVGPWRVVPAKALEENDRGPSSVEGSELVAGETFGALPGGTLAAWAFDVTPGADAQPSKPYYLPDGSGGRGGESRSFDPLRDTLYDWGAVKDATLLGEPFGPPPLVARFHLDIGAQQVVIEREVVERVSDQAVGEVRRPLRIVPAVEVSVEPELVVWSASWNGASSVGRAGHPAAAHLGKIEPPRAKLLKIALRSHVNRPLAGRVHLETPDGWPAVTPEPFKIEEPYGDDAVEIPFRPPAGLDRGHYRIEVTAEVDGGPDGQGGGTYGASYPRVDYPHIRPTPSPHEAEIEVAAADIRVPPLHAVGFLVGASDKVPQDLAAIGVPVETLTGADLAAREPADLARYDAIVVGSRAYETDAELGRVNAKLLDYARGGGLVIVLYQQYQFIRGGFAPYPLEIARPHDRVTDETAPVLLLEPESPVFTTPNRLGPEDWEGWVQERGLYFAHTWDAHYRPLLQFPSDPALAEQGQGGNDDGGAEGLRGGLLVAPVGDGTYVYTGLAFFRQLPAGVTGAYRLFANLLGLAHSRAGSSAAR